MEQMNEIVYTKTDNLLNDAKSIIESAQQFAYSAVNFAIIQRNWLLGKRIAEEEQTAKAGRNMASRL